MHKSSKHKNKNIWRVFGDFWRVFISIMEMEKSPALKYELYVNTELLFLYATHYANKPNFALDIFFVYPFSPKNSNYII